MQWWGWMIIGASLLGAIGTLLASFKITRSEVDRTKIAVEEEKALRDQLAASKAAEKNAEVRAKELAKKLESNRAWYLDSVRKIRREAKNDQENYLDDPSAIDRKLDELLAKRDPEDDTEN